jgi:hypothetical protein
MRYYARLEFVEGLFIRKNHEFVPKKSFFLKPIANKYIVNTGPAVLSLFLCITSFYT